ncbi:MULTISPECIES: hypothetical protein [Bartonella]|uniref:hypothetical protein n=1 Tax=Bartonella TaxID=773 RepID=UPI0018DBA1F1|nr:MULTISPECIES: hypothetical protein [Bartonella]MBH9994039.1 hypothetical protein [Bartonella sp. P0291]MBH9997616.1 hypothetical protein [Bartonella sp. M0192]MBH9999776.1 hypothetical protein [Bartonella sp. M0191]MBI0008330.1 hypothetical protein [Bartonella sp. M0193]MBI0011067.1 hypothetical protein [Bartonella sp. M0176]
MGVKIMFSRISPLNPRGFSSKSFYARLDIAVDEPVFLTVTKVSYNHTYERTGA